MNIVILGDTGFIGHCLYAFLCKQGHQVFIVSHKPNTSLDMLTYDQIWPITNIDVLFNLTGETVIDWYWTSSFRKKLIDSRLDPIRFVIEKIKRKEIDIKHWIQATSVQRYEPDASYAYTEKDTPIKHSSRLLHTLCQKSELAAWGLLPEGIKVSLAVLGTVLHPHFGYLRAQIRLYKYGLGYIIGDGHQYISWISIEDAVYALSLMMTSNSLLPVTVITAPHPVSQQVFSEVVCSHYGYKPRIQISVAIIERVLGQLAREVFLNSHRAFPAALMQNDFIFKSPTIQECIKKYL